MLARSVALAARALIARESMALVLGVAIAGAPGGMVPVAHALSVAATGLDSTVGAVRAVVLVVGITALAHTLGRSLDLIQDRAIPTLRPGTQGCLGTLLTLVHSHHPM